MPEREKRRIHCPEEITVFVVKVVLLYGAFMFLSMATKQQIEWLLF